MSPICVHLYTLFWAGSLHVDDAISHDMHCQNPVCSALENSFAIFSVLYGFDLDNFFIGMNKYFF